MYDFLPQHGWLLGQKPSLFRTVGFASRDLKSYKGNGFQSRILFCFGQRPLEARSRDGMFLDWMDVLAMDLWFLPVKLV